MQKIFYNGNIETFDKNLPKAEAFLVNNENIVFVGTNDEVMSMKTDETEIIDLNKKIVIPSFYDTGASVYKMIEQRLKNANKEKNIENNAEIDLNYEKFDNYEEYKQEFKILEKEFFKAGITTIFEMNICSKEFTFWKKLSDSGELQIDIIGYISITTDKDIMDNNCKSYRRYKNHFRLGGYYIDIDDKLSKKGAWIKKRYRGEKTYSGYTLVLDEQLTFLIKNVLAEKKQFIVETNGDNALDQFIRCFKDNMKDKEDLDIFRPIAKNCNFISKSQLSEMKEIGISPSFDIKEIKRNGQYFKKILGILRAKKIQPVKLVLENDMKFLLTSNENEISNIFELAYLATDRTTIGKRKLGKKYEISFDQALKSLIEYSSFFAFDLGIKGSIENGKKADFIILEKTLQEIEQQKDFDCILKTFIEGKEVFSK